jgi:hypothetical protein
LGYQLTPLLYLIEKILNRKNVSGTIMKTFFFFTSEKNPIKFYVPQNGVIKIFCVHKKGTTLFSEV